MFFRFIAFTVGLIAVIKGYSSYDASQATASIPLISGGLVMVIALFNLLPKIRRCPACHKKIATRATTCRHCGKVLEMQNPAKGEG